jgi:hypothetical protein
MIRYYVYFDAYGHPRGAVSAQELRERFENDPEAFRRSASRIPQDASAHFSVGHVGVLTFGDAQELKCFLDSMGDEIAGFYDGLGESRPYNF